MLPGQIIADLLPSLLSHLDSVLFAHGIPLSRPTLTLRGLKSMAVWVEILSPAIESEGLTRVALQTEVEARLRQAAIRIVEIEQTYRETNRGGTYLSVKVDAFTHPHLPDLHACSIRVELKQLVILLREPCVWTAATTWEAGTVGIVSRAKVPSIREYVFDLVDRLIDAYSAVNRKDSL